MHVQNKYMIIVRATGENSHSRRHDQWGRVVDDPHKLYRSTPSPCDVEESGHLYSKHSAYFWSEMVSGVWVWNVCGVYQAFCGSCSPQWAVLPASFWMICGPVRWLWRRTNGECTHLLWTHQKENKRCTYSSSYSSDARGMSPSADLQGRRPPCTGCTEPRTGDTAQPAVYRLSVVCWQLCGLEDRPVSKQYSLPYYLSTLWLPGSHTDERRTHHDYASWPPH